MNKYTTKEIQANIEAIKVTVKKFDQFAEILSEYFTKSEDERFDLIVSVEYLGSNNIISTMSRYLTK